MIFILFHFFLSPLQDTEGWQLLTTTTWEKGEIDIGFDFSTPTFSHELKVYEGKNFEVEGFVLPTSFSVESGFFILSRYPYQSCFFCGMAGPETVIEVYAESIGYLMPDQKIKVSGSLSLNETDPFHLPFQLMKATIRGK